MDSFLAPLLGPILAGEEQPTLVVFTADHGEALGDHGELTHGLFAYEATLEVPLVLWGGPVEPGIDTRAARHIDLVPTLLEALGEPPAAGLRGHSLLRPPPPPPPTYFESLSTHLELGWAPLRGVIRQRMKLIELPLPELYDLDADPGETRNLFAERPETARSLANLLPVEERWPPLAEPVPAAEADRLRSLGYLGGRSPSPGALTADDDPKRLVALDREITRMGRLAASGDLEQAIQIGRELLGRRPTMSVVYLQVATWQIRLGDLAGAVATLEEARRRGVASREVRRQLGLSLTSVGRAREAVEILRPLAADPADVESQNHLALALTGLGRLEAATEVLHAALERDPEFARSSENLAYVAILGERFAEAADHARRALAIDDALPDAWNNLAVALYRQGRPGEASVAWRRYLALAPADLETLFNLGVAELEAGQAQAARATLTRFAAAATGAEHATRRRQARQLLAELGAS